MGLILVTFAEPDLEQLIEPADIGLYLVKRGILRNYGGISEKSSVFLRYFRNIKDKFLTR